jgi:hypothetical protein
MILDTNAVSGLLEGGLGPPLLVIVTSRRER